MIFIDSLSIANVYKQGYFYVVYAVLKNKNGDYRESKLLDCSA